MEVVPLSSRLVMVALGWSPRPDLERALAPYLPADLQLSQVGLCDDPALDLPQPTCGEDILVTRSPCGDVVSLPTAWARQRLEQILQLPELDEAVVALMCTGDIGPEPPDPRLLLPGLLMAEQLPRAGGDHAVLGVLVPSPRQLQAARIRWHRRTGLAIRAAAMPPHGRPVLPAGLDSATTVVMDCISYPAEQAESIARALGVRVVRPISVLGRALARVLGSSAGG